MVSVTTEHQTITEVVMEIDEQCARIKALLADMRRCQQQHMGVIERAFERIMVVVEEMKNGDE